MPPIDAHPTRIYEGFKLRQGQVMPYGATIVPNGINFSVNSKDTTGCKLVLFHRGDPEPFATIPFFDDFRIGNVYSMIVYGLDYSEIEYGYIFEGPYDERMGLRFDPTKILIDPYSREISGREVWGGESKPFRSRVTLDDFDWQGDRPLEHDMRELIIYEMHVRGFTRHESSGVGQRGTYEGVIEKIPHLKELGVNCVELMPVFEFDELENPLVGENGERLLNYWGYSTVAFFAPKAGFAASGKRGYQIDEFKNMVRALHKNGIEVILDVVFNHTAEGNESGPYISFRGIDNRVYYMLTPDGSYQNFSGCGNTMNCNHPIVRDLILECLRYWTAEFHIDGFRFDLASILGRNQDGTPMANPPLLEILAQDPVLGRTKLIAEAWDAGGMYQVGSFPSWGRWAEWNGRYRDDVRKFLKGDFGMVWLAAEYIKGSPHMYNVEYRGDCASINFITCHDGFTLMDLYSYNEKNNMANGEENKDGTNENYSWDCKLPNSTDEGTLALRKRMVKNAMAFLLLSHSVPMILAGDEFCNSQGGNNNAYCQDNETSWLDWGDLEKNRDVFGFVKRMIALRRECDCLKSPKDIHSGRTRDGLPVISFHGIRVGNPDFSPGSTTLGVMFCDDDNCVYAAFNMHWEEHDFDLPELPEGRRWVVYESTFDASLARRVVDPIMAVPPRSVVILRA